MRLRWFGQSAFLLEGTKRILIDPFGEMTERLAARGMVFRHPAVTGVAADLVLVTHEHGDHNGIDGAEGSPVVLRSTAGTLDSPICISSFPPGVRFCTVCSPTSVSHMLPSRSKAMPCGRTNSPAPQVSRKCPAASKTMTGHWPRLKT